jgi:hypothetical protein
LDAAGRRRREVTARSEIGGAAGVADFEHERFLYDAGGGGLEIFTPGG